MPSNTTNFAQSVIRLGALVHPTSFNLTMPFCQRLLWISRAKAARMCVNGRNGPRLCENSASYKIMAKIVEILGSLIELSQNSRERDDEQHHFAEISDFSHSLGRKLTWSERADCCRSRGRKFLDPIFEKQPFDPQLIKTYRQWRQRAQTTRCWLVLILSRSAPKPAIGPAQ